MSGMLAFIKHLFRAMLKGFIFAGVGAALVCAAILLITEPGHQVTLDVPAVFALVICGLAAILGAAVALIYHLSHLDGIHHTVQHYSETRAAQHQQARLK
jgi:hypothetical protein